MNTSAQPSHSLTRFEGIFRIERDEIDVRNLIAEYVGNNASFIQISGIVASKLKDWLGREQLEQLATHSSLTGGNVMKMDGGVLKLPCGLLELTLLQERPLARVHYKQSMRQEAEDYACRFNSFCRLSDVKPTIGFLSKPEGGGIEFLDFEVEKKKLDIELLYGAAFVSTYQHMVAQLRRRKGSGLIVLHGAPGTGKTMLIRHLISTLRTKKFLFIPVDMVEELTGPQLLQVLHSEKGAVLVIEEAEGLLRPRSESTKPSAVTNLLNITDGLLKDFLQFQVICTFNCDIKQVDSALLRKGRLIAEHRFEALPVNEARLVATKFGLPVMPSEPMTLAEIFGAADRVVTSFSSKQVVGFRKENFVGNSN